MNVLSAPVTVLLSELNSEPSLLMAGALTTFVTVIVSVPSTVDDRAVAGGAPNLAVDGGGWPAVGAGGTADEPGGGGSGAELVCRGSGKGARGAAGNGTVLNRGTGAATFGVTQLLSDVCTCTTVFTNFHR